MFGQPSDIKELDFEFSLEDLETIKVIGKGSGGVVQLVRHKWVGQLFALKVILPQKPMFAIPCQLLVYMILINYHNLIINFTFEFDISCYMS